MRPAGGPGPVAGLVVAALLAAVLGGGCGGGEESGGASRAQLAAERSAAESRHVSEQFITPGEKDNAQTFGTEATAAERKAVSEGLSGYLQARAEEDWARACEHLSPRSLAIVTGRQVGPGGKGGEGCPEKLEAIYSGASAARLEDTLTGTVDSVRQEGDSGGGSRAFAFYHGADGADYYVPMQIDGGTWKVSALAPTRLP